MGKRYDQTELPDRIVRELLETAEEKDNDIILSGKHVRTILEELQIEWMPYVAKGRSKEAALQTFKAGVRARFGAKNVKFDLSTTMSKGREHDYLVVSVLGWPYDDLEGLLKASGLSRYFEQWGSGCGGAYRDLSFGSKKGRKPRGE